jgi:hypothetical protein
MSGYKKKKSPHGPQAERFKYRNAAAHDVRPRVSGGRVRVHQPQAGGGNDDEKPYNSGKHVA